VIDNPDQSAGFTRTGHDLPDFGTVVLMAWAGLPEDASPEDLTVSHIRRFAAEVEKYYFKKPDSFKSVMLAFGSNFLNPSFTPDKQLENIRAHLLAFEAEPNLALPPCTFFGRPSVREVARDAYPLLMGREPINFYPGGVPGIAMSGQAITAAQALIFGALRSQGKLMVIGADDFGLVRDIVNEWVGILRKRITLSQLNSDANLDDIAPPRTALVKTLEVMENKRHKRYRGGATLYHFSIAGRGPRWIFTNCRPAF
jgi:CRISPR-associated protein Cst1